MDFDPMRDFVLIENNDAFVFKIFHEKPVRLGFPKTRVCLCFEIHEKFGFSREFVYVLKLIRKW